ncbi:MAG: hypothetical protein E7Z99_00500 [Coriobacteriaceae bacterium]|nr:hypothetical protein [Coriobacteriaceae bacterium]
MGRRAIAKQIAYDSRDAFCRLISRITIGSKRANFSASSQHMGCRMKTSSKKQLSKLFWGPMASLELSKRVVTLTFTVVAIASLSFCQLAFFPVAEVGGDQVYVLLTIAPLLMGAILFGPLMGLCLGLYAGTVLFIHANVLPLDYYEYYYLTGPLSSLVLFTCVGAVAGFAFHFISTRKLSAAVRGALVILFCMFASVVVSGVLVALVISANTALGSLQLSNDELFISQTGVIIQMVIDGVAASAVCLAANAIAKRVSRTGAKRKLSSVFQNWMILVSAIVFMVTSSAIFTLESLNCYNKAQENMRSEVAYLASQLETSDDEGTLSIDPKRLLTGYSVDLDGSVLLTDLSGTILATDDPDRWPVGESYSELSGYSNQAIAEYYNVEYYSESSCLVLKVLSEMEYAQEMQLRDADGRVMTQPVYAYSESYGAGYAVMMRDTAAVFATRSGTMTAATVLAALLIAAIAALANGLLRRMVVRHIDDTNSSLEKITYGNLNVRVDDQDTIEFDSLSSGINATVVALKETIDEVEHRNAQDLATAKAIQEDALPKDFPAFPDIDKFDIYASMKTAKEVGGDFYDFFEIEGTTKIGFVMADVSGKGIPAALFMMTSKTQLRNHMQAGMSVDEAVNAANHQLCLGNEAGMFVTALVCMLDYETGHIEYVNAGHNPPLVLHDGAWSWKTEVSGMPLGLFDGIPYDLLEFDMAPEDTFYLYTDGVTEAMNVSDELFGEERLEQTLGHYSGMNPRSIGVGVRRALTDFTQDAEQSDDITMLALKYGVPPEEKAVMVLEAKRNQLVHVVNYIHAELYRRRAPKSVYPQLDLACEELFTNVCSYAYPDATEENPGAVRIQFEYTPTPPTLTVQISDDGVPYNPLEKEDAKTADQFDDVMDIPIGGLGILLAKKNVDEMTYERKDGTSNVVTLKKSW